MRVKTHLEEPQISLDFDCFSTTNADVSLKLNECTSILGTSEIRESATIENEKKKCYK